MCFIGSPGNLPNHLTVEKIRAGNSVIRNPVLASYAAKGLLPYRGLGTGIRRALADWPAVDLLDDRDACTFTATVRLSTAKNAPITTGNAPTNAPLTDLQRARFGGRVLGRQGIGWSLMAYDGSILAYARQHGSIGSSECQGRERPRQRQRSLPPLLEAPSRCGRGKLIGDLEGTCAVVFRAVSVAIPLSVEQ